MFAASLRRFEVLKARVALLVPGRKRSYNHSHEIDGFSKGKMVIATMMIVTILVTLVLTMEKASATIDYGDAVIQASKMDL